MNATVAGRIGSALAAALLTLPGATLADAGKQARAKIAATLKSLDAAAARKDAEAVWAARTQDFVSVSRDGVTRSAPEMRETMSRLFARAESLQGKSTIETFTLKGRVATVITRESGTIVMVNPDTGEKAVMKVDGRYEQTWIKQGKQWLQKRERSLASKVTVNGKPVEP